METPSHKHPPPYAPALRPAATAMAGEDADDATMPTIPAAATTTSSSSSHGARPRRRTDTTERVGVNGPSTTTSTTSAASARGDALEPAAFSHVAEPDDDEAAVAGLEEGVPEEITALKAARGEVSALDVAQPAKAPLTQVRRPGRLRRWELADQALSIPIHNADLGLLGELVALVPATLFQPFSVPLLLCAAYFLAHERFFVEALAGTCVRAAVRRGLTWWC
jgi:hypothetical protein